MAKKNPSRKKSAAKKTSAKPNKNRAPARHAPRAQPAGLTREGKLGLLKPASDYDTVAADAIAAWKSNGRYIKVPDMTAASLGRDVRVATRAWDKERVLRAKMDAKLQPLADARMRAESQAMRGLLDLYAEVKSSARRRPELLDAFASLADFAGRGGGGGGGGGGDTGGGAPTPPGA